MVAGYHNRRNSGLITFLNGCLNFRSYRVNHTCQTQEAKVVLKSFNGNIRRHFLMYRHSCHKNPEGLVSHFLVSLQDSSSVFFADVNKFSVSIYLGAPFENLIRCSLGVLNNSVVFFVLVKSGHHLTAAVKRNFTHSWKFLFHIAFINSQLVCIIYKGTFCRFSGGTLGAFLDFSITAKSHCLCQEVFVFAVIIHHGHLILGKGTCFIGADNLRTAESFNGCQLSDDGVSLRHIGYAYGKDYGHNCNQTLRYSRNCQADRNHKGIKENLSCYFACSEKTYSEDYNTDCQYQHCQYF